MGNLNVVDLFEKADNAKVNNFADHVSSELKVVTDYDKIECNYEWLEIMEDTIRYIDNILRNPNRFIVNEEDIIKVELAKKIGVESIKHLSRNTNLIQDYNKKTGDVRPSKILNINKEGEIVTFEKIKSHKKAVERAIELVSTDLDKCKDAKLFIYHTLREDDGKNLCKYFEEKYPQFGKVELKVVTPAVGAHIGYGILGFSYFMLEKK